MARALTLTEAFPKTEAGAQPVMVIDRRTQTQCVSQLERLGLSTWALPSLAEAIQGLATRRPQAILLAATLAQDDLPRAWQLTGTAREAGVPVLVLSADEVSSAPLVTKLGASGLLSERHFSRDLSAWLTQRAQAEVAAPPPTRDWVQRVAPTVPGEALLAVDFGVLTRELPGLSEDLQGLVRLFDGRRTVAEVVRDSELDEALTLEATTRLLLLGIVSRVKPAAKELVRFKAAPSLFGVPAPAAPPIEDEGWGAGHVAEPSADALRVIEQVEARAEEARAAEEATWPRDEAQALDRALKRSSASTAANTDAPPVTPPPARREADEVPDRQVLRRTRPGGGPLSAQELSEALVARADEIPEGRLESRRAKESVRADVRANAERGEVRHEDLAEESEEVRRAVAPETSPGRLDPQSTGQVRRTDDSAPLARPETHERGSRREVIRAEASEGLAARLAPQGAGQVRRAEDSAPLARPETHERGSRGEVIRAEASEGLARLAPQGAGQVRRAEELGLGEPAARRSFEDLPPVGAAQYVPGERRSGQVRRAEDSAPDTSRGAKPVPRQEPALRSRPEARDEDSASLAQTIVMTRGEASRAPRTEDVSTSIEGRSASPDTSAPVASDTHTRAARPETSSQRDNATRPSVDTPHTAARSQPNPRFSRLDSSAQTPGDEAHAQPDRRSARPDAAHAPSSRTDVSAQLDSSTQTPRAEPDAPGAHARPGAAAAPPDRDHLEAWLSAPSEAAKVEAAKVAPAKVEPAKVEPAKVEPAKPARKSSATVASPRRARRVDPDEDDDDASSYTYEPLHRRPIALEPEELSEGPTDGDAPEDLVNYRSRSTPLLVVVALAALAVLALLAWSSFGSSQAPVPSPVTEAPEPLTAAEPSIDPRPSVLEQWQAWELPVPESTAAVEPQADVSGPLKVASDLYEAGRLKDARAALEELTTSNPDAAPAWLLLGQVKFDQRDLPGAKDAAAHALSVDPKLSRAAMLQAALAIDAKDAPAAKDALERALAIDPQGPDAAEARALLAHGL